MRVIDRIAEFVGAVVCIGTVLAFFRTDQWWVRMFDFPRVQLLLLGLLVLVFLLGRFRKTMTADRILIAFLALAVLAQSVQIFPYTPIATEQVRPAEGDGPSISIFMANVLQENRRSEGLFQQIGEKAPDIILLNETDEWWAQEVAWLKDHYPYSVIHPQDNTYGMILYSRLPLIGPEVLFLIDPKVPSIRTDVELAGGNIIRFHGVHPRPPATKDPDMEERQDSDQRDAELVVLARQVDDLELPVVVAGDFNDVAWSHTTRLFQRTGELLDPRVGRGFFNTYNSKNLLFRYPLDHLFHSEHFTLVSIERLDHFGSDHFPMHVELMLEPRAVLQQEPPEEKKGDRTEERKIMEREAQEDERPE